MREGGGSCADDVVAQHHSTSSFHFWKASASHAGSGIRFVSEYTRYRVHVAVYGMKVAMDNKIEGDAGAANRILL